jgi:hypothetical protein
LAAWKHWNLHHRPLHGLAARALLKFLSSGLDDVDVNVRVPIYNVNHN